MIQCLRIDTIVSFSVLSSNSDQYFQHHENRRVGFVRDTLHCFLIFVWVCSPGVKPANELKRFRILLINSMTLKNLLGAIGTRCVY